MIKGWQIITIMAVFFLAFGFSDVQAYYFEGYTSSDYNDNVVYGLGFNNSACEVTMETTSTFTASSSFDTLATYYSPDSTPLMNGAEYTITNTSCLSYGKLPLTASVPVPSTGLVETKTTYQQTADSGFLTMTTGFSCTDNSGYFMNFTISDQNDSRAFCTYPMRVGIASQRVAYVNTLIANYGRCGDTSDWIQMPCNLKPYKAVGNVTAQFIYPFNASGGTVSFTFHAPDGALLVPNTQHAHYTIDLLRTTDNTVVNYYSESYVHSGGGTSAPFQTDYTDTKLLLADVNYLWIVTFEVESNGVLGGFDDFSPPVLDMSIFNYHGDFVCGDWSECSDNIQTRSCVDSNNIALPYAETRSCFDIPETDILIGFEETHVENIKMCDIGWTVVDCPFSMRNEDFELPAGWSDSSPISCGGARCRNYIQMVDTTSTQGVKSLRMHYVPPRMGEPISTSCGNLTTGASPEVSTPYNESLFVAYNVSFDSPYAQIRYDVKRCDEHVVQFDHSNDWVFELQCGANMDLKGIPRKYCYARDCNSTVYGKYGIRLIDSTTSEVIVDLIKESELAWQTNNIIDLTNVGLSVGRNYTIGIAVNPESLYSKDGHCVYFDNVRATFTETPLPECISECNGFDYLQATSLNNTICVFETIKNSPECAPDQTTADKMANFEPFCDEFNTRYVYNNATGIWDELTDNELCISEQETTELPDNVPDALESIAQGAGEFSPLLSLFMIGIFIVAGGMFMTARYTKESTPILGIGLVLTVAMVFIGFFPLVYGFMIGAGIGLLIAYELRKGVGG